jgi:hypothetical protein
MTRLPLRFAAALAMLSATALPLMAQDAPSLKIVWPPEGSSIVLGSDPEGVVGVVVESNFKLMPAGACGDDSRCGHVHMKIDPDGDSCNIPGRAYNSMNSDFGGDLVKARFAHCPSPRGEHVIGILLADDRHQPILVEGKPVTALVRVRTQ